MPELVLRIPEEVVQTLADRARVADVTQPDPMHLISWIQQLTFASVLTDKEQALLRTVKTDRDQALTICLRNLLLLYKLANPDDPCGDPWEEVRTFVGCPHCHFRNSSNRCKGCAWHMPLVLANRPARLPCCDVTFGGVTLFSAALVNYANSWECLDYTNLTAESILRPGVPRTELMTYQRAYTFLTGHIEWALSVLAAR